MADDDTEEIREDDTKEVVVREGTTIPTWLAGALVVVLAIAIGGVGYAIGNSDSNNDFLDQMALQFTEPLPGFPDFAGIVGQYERHLGRALDDLGWYEIWGGFRAACIQVPLFGAGDNPLTTELLDRIG